MSSEESRIDNEEGIAEKSDPYMMKRCERNDCPVCDMGNPGEWRTRGCGYQLPCKEDGRKY